MAKPSEAVDIIKEAAQRQKAQREAAKKTAEDIRAERSGVESEVSQPGLPRT